MTFSDSGTGSTLTIPQYVRLIIGKTGMVIAPLLIALYACLGVMIWQNF